MNKRFTKWIKRIGISIGILLSTFLLYALSVTGYYNLYVPYHINSLYHKGLQYPDRAEEIIKQLQNVDSDSAKTKALDLITYYAKRGNLNFKKLLEQHNESCSIALHSITPINKNVWNITIGKTSKQDILQYLDSLNLSHLELRDGYITQMYSNIEFIGVYWDEINFYFTDNKVYIIEFVSKQDIDGALKSYNSIKNILASKYTLTKNFKPNDYCYNLKFRIKDSHTQIELKTQMYDRFVRHRELIFKYIDFDSKTEKIKKDSKNI